MNLSSLKKSLYNIFSIEDFLSGAESIKEELKAFVTFRWGSEVVWEKIFELLKAEAPVKVFVSLLHQGVKTQLSANSGEAHIGHRLTIKINNVKISVSTRDTSFNLMGG